MKKMEDSFFASFIFFYKTTDVQYIKFALDGPSHDNADLNTF